MGFLTTHVLDTARGCPAEGVRVELYRDLDAGPQSLIAATTNDDGRCDQPLLQDDEFSPGTYELHFHVGEYYRKAGVDLDAPAFLDVVPIRFGISSRDNHYHVPLLVSPYGYSTYRGS